MKIFSRGWYKFRRHMLQSTTMMRISRTPNGEKTTDYLSILFLLHFVEITEISWKLESKPKKRQFRLTNEFIRSTASAEEANFIHYQLLFSLSLSSFFALDIHEGKVRLVGRSRHAYVWLVGPMNARAPVRWLSRNRRTLQALGGKRAQTTILYVHWLINAK